MWVILTDFASHDATREKWKCLLSTGLDSTDNLWAESSLSVVSHSVSLHSWARSVGQLLSSVTLKPLTLTPGIHFKSTKFSFSGHPQEPRAFHCVMRWAQLMPLLWAGEWEQGPG